MCVLGRRLPLHLVITIEALELLLMDVHVVLPQIQRDFARELTTHYFTPEKMPQSTKNVAATKQPLLPPLTDWADKPSQVTKRNITHD